MAEGTLFSLRERIEQDRYEQLEKVFKFDDKDDLYMIIEKDPAKGYRNSLVSAENGIIINESRFKNIITFYDSFKKLTAIVRQ